MTGRVTTVRAHAKLNLALAVAPPLPAGRPGAGYHPIDSVFCCVDLADTVTVTPGAAAELIRIRGSGPPAPEISWPLESDLSYRAWRALEQRVGKPLDARIEVVKSIPAGAGLGGGSADAGAVLLALRAAFGLTLGDDELIAVGAALGSDVPFFIDGTRAPARAARVSGLGERVERLVPRPGAPVLEAVIIIPPFGCETRAVYRAFDEQALPPRSQADAAVAPVAEALCAGAAVALDGAAFNDLTPAALRGRPELGVMSNAMMHATRLSVHMSGSGSTLFLLPAPGKAAAVRASVERCAGVTGCTVMTCRLIP